MGSVVWAVVTCREDIFKAVLGKKFVVYCFPLWVTGFGDSGDTHVLCAKHETC